MFHFNPMIKKLIRSSENWFIAPKLSLAIIKAYITWSHITSILIRERFQLITTINGLLSHRLGSFFYCAPCINWNPWWLTKPFKFFGSINIDNICFLVSQDLYSKIIMNHVEICYFTSYEHYFVYKTRSIFLGNFFLTCTCYYQFFFSLNLLNQSSCQDFGPNF
jgi:hypothetical protein